MLHDRPAATKLVPLTVAVLAMFVLAAPASGQGLPPPGPAPINITNTTVVQVPAPDPQAESNAAIIADQAFIVNVMQPIPVTWANTLCGFPNIWTTTPADLTYAAPQVIGLATMVNQAAFALTALAFAAVGLAGLAGRNTHELTGRLLFSCVLTAGNQIWWQWAIDLNNALTSVVSSPNPCTAFITPNIQIVNQTPDPLASLAPVALVIVTAIVSILLLMALVFRLVWIDVLLVAGPLAEMCWATQQSQHIARWYQRMVIGTVFGQVLLAIGFATAQVLSRLGSGPVIGALLAIVCLWACRNMLTALTKAFVSTDAHRGPVRMVTTAARVAARAL